MLRQFLLDLHLDMAKRPGGDMKQGWEGVLDSLSDLPHGDGMVRIAPMLVFTVQQAELLNEVLESLLVKVDVLAIHSPAVRPEPSSTDCTKFVGASSVETDRNFTVFHSGVVGELV